MIAPFLIHCGGVQRQNYTRLCHCSNIYKPNCIFPADSRLIIGAEVVGSSSYILHSIFKKAVCLAACCNEYLSSSLDSGLVSLLHGDKIRTPQSAGSNSGQEQACKPIVKTDSQYLARKEAAGSEGRKGGGGCIISRAAVYCQVFTLFLRCLRKKERDMDCGTSG